MVEWAKLCREASNREGHLDVKFLNARYNKGVKQVQDFMETNHKYFETTIGLVNAQAEILKFQRVFDNGNGQLDRLTLIFVFLVIAFILTGCGDSAKGQISPNLFVFPVELNFSQV